MLKFFKKDSYSAILRETSQEITPSPVTMRAMLGAVMPEAVEAGRVSYTDACDQVRQLARSARQRKKMALSLCMVAAVLVIFILPAQNAPVGGSQASAGVVVENTILATGIFSIMEEGVPLAAAPAPGLSEQPPAAQAETAIAIPAMDGYRVENGYVYIYFSDATFGVDWDAIYALDQEGQYIYPHTLLPEEGAAVFALPAADIDIYVPNMAGAVGCCKLRVQ